ncbi:hypothetical protein P8935_09085 [Telmatobacter sp. DSM 110680]|uniref:Uncharacterized protein n=1 Tax=Telmatobacter sp. DSM 110680 TaxID=3036704 RepID=A0AAU7DQD1_9BACT
MYFSTRCHFCFFLVPAALVFTAFAGAQSLERRPTSPSPEPAKDAAAEAAQPVLAKGTSLQVEIARHYPVKIGEPFEAHLMHPVYAAGKLVVPQNAVLEGHVIALQADTKTRWHARLRGDFTPFHTVQVQFDKLELPSGPIPIAAAPAANGAPVLKLSAPGVSPKQSFIARRWAEAKANMRDRLAYFTAPGKGDRALQVLYHQLPYHPERIEANTAWSFELSAPLSLPLETATLRAVPSPVAAASKNEVWAVNATLSRDLTSATAKPGDSVEALVVEPVYDKDKQLVVPQGSKLVGKVAVAKAARSFGRNGKLRFTFQQVKFPEGYNREVEGALAGAATEKTQNLSLDAEGTITPRSQSSVIVPLLLTMLAGRALDEDGNLTAQTGVASNGFGIVGRIVGIASGSRNLAAGLGFYAAGLSFYDNFLHSGRDVIFPRDTRIEIETTPLRAPVIRPEGQ